MMREGFSSSIQSKVMIIRQSAPKFIIWVIIMINNDNWLDSIPSFFSNNARKFPFGVSSREKLKFFGLR